MEKLLSDLLNMNPKENEEEFSNLFDICKKILSYWAFWKQKYARENHLIFMNKTFSKEVTKRNSEIVYWNIEIILFKKSIEKVVTVCLLPENQRIKIIILMKKVTNKKSLWNTMNLFLSDKVTSKKKLILIEKDEIVKKILMQ